MEECRERCVTVTLTNYGEVVAYRKVPNIIFKSSF